MIEMTGKEEKGGEVEEKEKWGSTLDFILSCLGYAVGLGNVWRFPYLCGRSGGAAFLIPYFIMMILAGMPSFYLELSLGQFSSLTPHLLYRRMSPIFAGIGYTMVMITAFTAIYYNMIIAWSLYYLGSSFTSHLPWDQCSHPWNNNHCWDSEISKSCNTSTQIYWKGHCQSLSNLSSSQIQDINAFWGANNSKETPAEQYLNIEVLHRSSGIAEIGYPQWKLVLALFAAWVLVGCCLIKGIKSSGKVVYFTATFPYLILIILMIRGVTLEGAYKGVEFYLIPRWERLKEAQVWGDAAVQIFFSLSLGSGGLTTLASYNKFHNNLLRDTLIVVFGNCLTSFFAGFVIFPIIGYMSLQTGKEVEDIAAGGTTLAFNAYPSALVRLPGAPAWAVLFFLMLIMLGIDSQLVLVEVVITAITDQWPRLRTAKLKALVVFGVCIVSFIIGLVLTCPGGSFVLDLLDTFAGGWPLVMASLVELVMVSYFYGVKRFLKDIRLMLGIAPNKFWKYLGYPVNPYWWVNWSIISPLLLSGVLIFNWVGWEGLDRTFYPRWSEILGWLIAGFCVSWIFILGAIVAIKTLRKGGSFGDLIRPSEDWGPSDPDAKMTLNQEYTLCRAYGNPSFDSRRSDLDETGASPRFHQKF